MTEKKGVDIIGDITIGTRGSPLALEQAYETRHRLEQAHKGLSVSIEIISTKGDRITDRPLSDIGGKGLFTQEIEERLLDGRIDIAVHSSKDMPTQLPDGLYLSCFLPREEEGDAFISQKAERLEDLPEGAIIGSSSLRRRALIARLRPDLVLVEFRGNVQTRLQKLDDGIADATLLATAGLNRLGLAHIIASKLDLDAFPPAPGQGAICIESRLDDARIDALLAPLNDENTSIRLDAERAFLRELDGSCRTPLAGLATLSDDKLKFHGMILTPDGAEFYETRLEGNIDEAEAMGQQAARILRDQAGENFFEDWYKPSGMIGTAKT